MIITGYYYSNQSDKFLGTTNYADYKDYILDFQQKDGVETIISLETILKIKQHLYDEIQILLNNRKQINLPPPINPIERKFMNELIVFHAASRLDIKLLFKVNFYNFIEEVLIIENAVLFFFYTTNNAIFPNRLAEVLNLNIKN